MNSLLFFVIVVSPLALSVRPYLFRENDAMPKIPVIKEISSGTQDTLSSQTTIGGSFDLLSEQKLKAIYGDVTVDFSDSTRSWYLKASIFQGMANETESFSEETWRSATQIRGDPLPTDNEIAILQQTGEYKIETEKKNFGAFASFCLRYKKYIYLAPCHFEARRLQINDTGNVKVTKTDTLFVGSYSEAIDRYDSLNSYDLPEHRNEFQMHYNRHYYEKFLGTGFDILYNSHNQSILISTRFGYSSEYDIMNDWTQTVLCRFTYDSRKWGLRLGGEVRNKSDIFGTEDFEILMYIGKLIPISKVVDLFSAPY